MRTILFASVLALGAVTTVGCSKDKAEKSEHAGEQFPEMTLDDVEKGLAANEITAVDCNGDNTRKKYGAVPGAVMVADEEAYPASDLPADKARKLVFYCSGPT